MKTVLLIYISVEARTLARRHGVAYVSAPIIPFPASSQTGGASYQRVSAGRLSTGGGGEARRAAADAGRTAGYVGEVIARGSGQSRVSA